MKVTISVALAMILELEGREISGIVEPNGLQNSPPLGFPAFDLIISKSSSALSPTVSRNLGQSCS